MSFQKYSSHHRNCQAALTMLNVNLYLLTSRNNPQIWKIANQNINSLSCFTDQEVHSQQFKTWLMTWQWLYDYSSFLMQTGVICTVSVLSQDFIHLFIIYIYTNTDMCMRICSLYMYHRNVHEDLPSSLFIQKSAIYEVEDQPRFFMLWIVITGPNFVADSKNIEFIPGMKHNAETMDRGSFWDSFEISLWFRGCYAKNLAP